MQTIESIGRGVIASLGIEQNSWNDRLVASGFHMGGWIDAEFTRAVLVFIPAFAALCFLFFIAAQLRSRIGFWVRWAIWVIWLGVTIFSIGRSWIQYQQIRNLRLLAPVALLEAAQKVGGRVFYNPSAVWSVATFAPQLLDKALSQRQRAELVQLPVLWRKEDRAKPWTAVVLASYLSEARPLIEYLLVSPDWYLASADNQGLLFLRGTGQDFSPPPPEKAPPFALPEERAVFLAQAALSFEAVDLKTDARAYMDEALEIAPENFEVLVRAASLASSHGRWARARSLTERALRVNSGSTQAEYLYAVSLLETGALDKAFALADRLARSHPRDSTILLLHARIAHAVHDYSAEIDSLQKLLAIAAANHISPVRIHVYLGQAWAQKGFANQALEHYRAALQGQLTPNEERDIREAISTIEAKRLPQAY